jgi:DNA-binding response OmpR family regulator
LLYIQDNSLVQNFYREKLERAGFAVQSVSSVEEGLRRMENTLPDVVLLDPLLQEGDAVRSIASLRAAKGVGEIPMVVLPTIQRGLAESIEQLGRTKLVEAAGNIVANVLSAAADAVNMKVPDLGEVADDGRPDEGWRRAALNTAPAAVAEMRVTLHSVVRDPSGSEPLRTLLQNVHVLADRMSLLGPCAISRVASALEVLAYGLVEIPDRLEPLTLRSLGQAVDFLGALLETGNSLKPSSVGSAHVMIVEDEANARELIIMAMGLVGLTADGLDSPTASLAVLSGQACDLIFLDINLPEMNGFELCTKLREISFHEKTPVVFITGMNSFQNRVQSNLSGGNDFVGKPFNIAELGLKALIWVLRGQFGMT